MRASNPSKLKSVFALLAIVSVACLSLSGTARAALVGNTNQATLSLSPATGTYNAGDSFSVSIFVNTHGQNINAVAAYLTFDRNNFQAVSIDTAGSLFTMQAEGQIDSASGKIKITRGVTAPNTVNTANGLVAKINFKAVYSVSPSSDNFTFDFAAGDTGKSNVFLPDQKGTPILSGVYNAKYSVTGGIPNPNPSSTPTPTPTPTPATPTPTPAIPTPTPFRTYPTPAVTPIPIPLNASADAMTPIPVFYFTLVPGASNTDALALQNFLISRGFMAFSSRTGTFDFLTQDTAKRYIAAFNAFRQGQLLGQSGGGCVPTYASSTLPLLPSFAPPLSFGMRGANVLTLQNHLIRYKYMAAGLNTGYYGTITQAAVAKYNADRNTKVQLTSCPASGTAVSTSRLPKTFRFMAVLKQGMSSADVKNLQIFLNDQGFAVSAAGAGSKGNETSYFGPATFKAIVRFQNANSATILIPNGLKQGTGFFGASTMKVANEMISK